MEKNNIERIKDIAFGLKELNQRVVYVGGAVVQFYATSSGSPEARSTQDVDCIIKYNSFADKLLFEEELRKKHFNEELVDGVICRWAHHDNKVDIMPTDSRYLSFTNRWYEHGYEAKIAYQVSDDCQIFILPVLFYLATKFEAIYRDGDDLRCSHDFEDIVYVLNSCDNIVDIFENEKNPLLKKYICEKSNEILRRPTIHEEIECVMPLGEEERSDMVYKQLKCFGSYDNKRQK